MLAGSIPNPVFCKLVAFCANQFPYGAEVLLGRSLCVSLRVPYSDLASGLSFPDLSIPMPGSIYARPVGSCEAYWIMSVLVRGVGCMTFRHFQARHFDSLRNNLLSKTFRLSIPCTILGVAEGCQVLWSLAMAEGTTVMALNGKEGNFKAAPGFCRFKASTRCSMRAGRSHLLCL